MHDSDASSPPAVLIRPTVHHNGSGRSILLEEFATGASAVQRAIECLSDAAPHGRDYYPQGIEAWQSARRQHESRVARLRSVLAELEELRRGLGR